MKITNSEEHDRAVRRSRNLNGWLADKTTTESLRQALLAEYTEIEAALDDYYQRENAEWEKANMSEERKPLFTAQEVMGRLMASRKPGEPWAADLDLCNRVVMEIIDTYEKRIAELEAAQRPANPAGDDIAKLIKEAHRHMEEADATSRYDAGTMHNTRATAYATVAMAMMRLREYEQ